MLLALCLCVWICMYPFGSKVLEAMSAVADSLTRGSALRSLRGTYRTPGVVVTPMATVACLCCCLQLYLNYKLKSVAHLPWRQMTYKFLNTIIDDLFAFVIKMPTLHRLSVFR